MLVYAASFNFLLRFVQHSLNVIFLIWITTDISSRKALRVTSWLRRRLISGLSTPKLSKSTLASAPATGRWNTILKRSMAGRLTGERADLATALVRPRWLNWMRRPKQNRRISTTSINKLVHLFLSMTCDWQFLSLFISNWNRFRFWCHILNRYDVWFNLQMAVTFLIGA